MFFLIVIGLFASKAIFPRQWRSASARKEHGHKNLSSAWVAARTQMAFLISPCPLRWILPVNPCS